MEYGCIGFDRGAKVVRQRSLMIEIERAVVVHFGDTLGDFYG
jgi:hypothetical protein